MSRQKISHHFYLVDCIWDEWEIGECSKECGGGARISIRTAKIKAAYGGKECSGPSSISDNCNIQDCPGIKDSLNTTMSSILFKIYRPKKMETTLGMKLQ